MSYTILLIRSASKYTKVQLKKKMEVKEGEYLDFVELGEFLAELAYKETSDFGCRAVHNTLVEEGKINLLTIDAGRYCYNAPSS